MWEYALGLDGILPLIKKNFERAAMTRIGRYQI
jgi:hypothetical protein